MREFAVTDAMPQKNCAPQTMKSRNFATVGLLRASRKICAGGSPVEVAASLVTPAWLPSWMAAVIEKSRIQPPTIEISTLITMPRGAAVEAFLVSSDTCADASYPVYVYCAMSRPMRNTYGANDQPVSLCHAVKVQPTSWCRVGMIQSAPTMMSTPTMCHHADTFDSSETSFTPKVFSRPCTTMSTTNSTNVLIAFTSMPHTRLPNAIMVTAAP